MQLLQDNMTQEKPKVGDKKKNLLLVQDLNYARNLAANDEKVRRKALKYLKKYLQQRSEGNNLNEENLKVLWKGLYFSMWMSDKPLVQEECAENIAHLIHCMPFNYAMEFFKIGFVTLQNEWFGIDQHRLDKFMMFVRRFLRQTLFVLKKVNFKKYYNEKFTQILQDTILSTTKAPPLGLFMHFTEIYLEELAKVADGKLQSLRTTDFIKPYVEKIAFATDQRVIDWTNKFIFTYLMKQHKLGLEYEEKYNIWRSQRFAGSINQIQKVIVPNDEDQDFDSLEENSVENKPLDPRAGKVDVELPQIQFNSKDIAEMLLAIKTNPKTTKHTRHFLTQWTERFQKLYQGAYPLGVKNIENGKKNKLKDYDTNPKKAAKRLIKFEQKLLEKSTNKRKSDLLESVDIPNKKIKKSCESDLNKTNNIKKLEEEINNMEKTILKRLENEIESCNKTKKRKPVDIQTTNDTERDLNESDDSPYCFRKNSGLWFVTHQDNDMNFTDSTDLDVSKWDSIPESEYQLQQTIKKPKIDTAIAIVPSTKVMDKSQIQGKQIKVQKSVSKLKGKNKKVVNKKGLQTQNKRALQTGIPKKVKINTKLNVSQDIHDHIQQVIASPTIPFDSSKKPGKPVLKTPVKASPINPFYKLKLF